MNTPIIPLELVEQVAKKGCVLFLGWSFDNAKPGLITEKILSQKLSERIGFNDPSKTLAEIAEYFEAQKSPYALHQYVYEVVMNYDEPPDFYNNLLKLPFNTIVSTSLDTYIKRVLQEMGEKYQYILRDEEIPFIENDKDTRIVVKLYGDIDNRASMIITKEQLIGFFDKLPSISDLLKYFFSTKTLVFVGYDLDDPHFSQLYAYTNQRTKGYQKRAFAIVPGVNEYQKTIWGRKNLTILDLDVDSFVSNLDASVKTHVIEKHKTIPFVDLKVTHKGFKSPYKFLNSFDEGDADIFFGREKEKYQSLHKLLSSKLMVLYGKSGYGKTSLLKAGIIPELLDSGFLPIYARCSIDPLLSIKANIIERLDKIPACKLIADRLRAFEKLPLLDFFAEFSRLQSSRLVILIDQFEEFFISLGDETKNQFIKELSSCVDSSLDITFLLSLREDFLADLQEIKVLRSLVGDSYRLRALNTLEAQSAIEEPAKKFGLTVGEQVVANVVDELSDKGQVDPAQLQIVCDHLYNKLPESSKEINESLYNDLGGVKQILADYLDEILYDFGSKRMSASHKILRNMVTSWFTKIPITFAEAVLYLGDMPEWSPEDTKELLSDLIKVRLIRRIVDTSDESYELTHEFLINKIREWIDLEQLKVKESLDLLRQELNNWQRHQIPMDKSRLSIIDAQKEKLILDNKQKAFMLIAATQYDFEFEYWLKRNEENHLVTENLFKLLQNADNLTKNLAGLGISAFSRDENIISSVLSSYANIANPNTIKRMMDLIEKSFGFPNGFEESVVNLVNDRFTRNMVLVPSGSFLMGTRKEKIMDYINQIPDPDKRPPLSFFDGQYPQKEIALDGFSIDKFLVTNAEYKEFKPGFTFEIGKDEHPVVGISYYDALEYAKWLSKDLPTEEEWEKAARGQDSRDFPWGNTWKSKDEGGFDVCNTSNTGHEGTTPVNMFPSGVSPFGCYDMAGNVWEWTTTSTEKEYKILRGGSWSRYSLLPWCWYRFSYKPDQGYPNVGFRCIKRQK